MIITVNQGNGSCEVGFQLISEFKDYLGAKQVAVERQVVNRLALIFHQAAICLIMVNQIIQ